MVVGPLKRSRAMRAAAAETRRRGQPVLDRRAIVTAAGECSAFWPCHGCPMRQVCLHAAASRLHTLDMLHNVECASRVAAL